MTIQHHIFESQRVVQGWYDASGQEITLEFPDGTLWWYRKCNQRVWDRLKQAESAGRFIADVLDGHRNGPV